jgi:hypothetical protein
MPSDYTTAFTVSMLCFGVLFVCKVVLGAFLQLYLEEFPPPPSRPEEKEKEKDKKGKKGGDGKKDKKTKKDKEEKNEKKKQKTL